VPPDSPAAALLFVATGVDGGEDEGGSVPHPLRTMAPSSAHPRLPQARVGITLIRLMVRETPYDNQIHDSENPEPYEPNQRT
jgi:hypothetical protein